MKMRRILSLLLVLVMSLSMVTVPAFAEGEADGKAVYDPAKSQVVVTADNLVGDNYIRLYYKNAQGTDTQKVLQYASAESLKAGAQVDVKSFESDEMSRKNVRDGKWTVYIMLMAGGAIGPITVELDPSVKDTLVTPSAEGLAGNITRANVRSADADDTVPEHDESLYESYDVTGEFDVDKENVVDVTINVVGMKAHYAGGTEVNNKGNWVGVAIPKIEDYTEVKDSEEPLTAKQVRYSYGWGTADEPEQEDTWTVLAKYGSDGEQPGVDSTHDTIYFNAALAEEHNKNAWIKAEYGTDGEPITIVLNITFEGDPLIQTYTVTKVVLGPDTDGIKVTEVWAKSNNDEAAKLTKDGVNDTLAVTLTADGGAYTLSLTDKLENAAFAEPNTTEETYFELVSSALTAYGEVSGIVKKDGAIKFNYAEHKYSVSVAVTDGENDIDTATVKLTKGEGTSASEYLLEYKIEEGAEHGAYVYPDEGKALPAGEYTLTVTKAGYQKVEMPVTIAYQTGTGVTDPKAITLEVELTNVEELGDLVCTYDKDKKAIMFAAAEDDTSYTGDYKIYYKASINKDDALEIVGADDEDAKLYDTEKGIELVYDDNNDYLNVNVVAVAIQGNLMSKPAKFTAPKFGEVEQIKGLDTGNTVYYSVPVENWVDGLYVAAYYTIDGKPEFTFTQVTEHTEVAVKKDCQGLMFILCVGRSDLSTVGEQTPMFFDIWPAAQNELTAG